MNATRTQRKGYGMRPPIVNSSRAEPALEELPRALRDLADVRSMRRNDLLFRRGEHARAVFCVLGGEVRLVRPTPDGIEIVQHRAGAGEFFAEAALSGGHYHCDAVCAAAGQVAVFGVEKLRSRMLQDPSLGMLWIEVLSRHLRGARNRIERLGVKGARQRVLHWLATEAGSSDAVRVTQPIKAWAHELGLAHETLYRALAELQANGVIRRRGRSITILRQ